MNWGYDVLKMKVINISILYAKKSLIIVGTILQY
jgi:hypothetical protein